MFDCGMHMGYQDQVCNRNKNCCSLIFLMVCLLTQRKFPNFSYITNEEKLDSFLDCVIITHFHLDHCGALPYMTEMVKYSGPIYMTHPTKAICPILLVNLSCFEPA